MNLPNIISLGRLLTVPVIVWFIMQGFVEAAFWLFVVAGISDAVDGFVAKRFDMESELGRYLDPIADKTLLVAIYITLGYQGHLPTWLVILVASRDILIVGGALLSYAMASGMRPKPLTISKINTATQIVLAACILGQLGLGLSVGGLVMVLIYVTGASTVLSGALYLIDWGRLMSGMEEPG